MKLYDYFALLVALIILAFVWYFIYFENKACGERGGTLVRGVVWFKYVGVK